MWGIHIFLFDKVFMQSKYHFLFSFKGSISENNYHKRKEKVSLSQETCSGVHALITCSTRGIQKNLRKQDAPKTSFRNAGRTGELHTRTPTGSLGDAM